MTARRDAAATPAPVGSNRTWSRLVNMLFFLVLSIVFLIPMYWMIVSSFRPQGEIFSNFTNLAPTTVTLDVAPEPIRKGATQLAFGVVQHLVNGTMTGWSGATLALEFQPAGATAYTPVATVRTTVGGAYAYVVTAKVDGTWRVRYAGDATTAPANATDYVDVR